MKIPKLLYVSTHSGPVGGGETYLLELAARMKGDFRVSFLVGGNPVFHELLKLNKFNFFTLQFSLLNIFSISRSLLAFCREHQIDLVHFNNRRDLIFAYIIARTLDIPVVLTMHTTIISRHVGLIENLKNLIYIGLFRVLGHKLHRYITVTQYNGALMHRWFGIPEKKIVVIYNGINPVGADNRNFLPTNNLVPVITVVAHLYPLKGIDVLLNALAVIKELPWKCLIIGEGPEHGRLLALAQRHRLQDKVIFTGRLPHAKVLDFIAKSRMVVLPTWYEAFPYSLLEAMSLGVPIITTRILGLPEIIPEGKNGLLVTPGRPTELAQAIQTLLTKPELAREMGQQGVRLIEMRFSQQQMADKTKCIYKTLLGIL